MNLQTMKRIQNFDIQCILNNYLELHENNFLVLLKTIHSFVILKYSYDQTIFSFVILQYSYDQTIFSFVIFQCSFVQSWEDFQVSTFFNNWEILKTVSRIILLACVYLPNLTDCEWLLPIELFFQLPTLFQIHYYYYLGNHNLIIIRIVIYEHCFYLVRST